MSIRTTIQNGRIEVDAPEGLVDGTPVVVAVFPTEQKIGISESEWQDDSQALADWERWLETIEPIDFDKSGTYEEEFRRLNIEAVRRQMYGD